MILSVLGLALSLAVTMQASVAWAGEVAIAAASDLNFAFKELIAEFEAKTGDRVKLSLGSSGNFFSQIQNGAPYDLYFSADVRYPERLIASGHALSDSLYRYAVGRIVVWVPKTSPLPVETSGLHVMLDPAAKKIAIANPKHAPYGRAAVSAMEHEQIYEEVKSKLVLGENISQAAQFVESGAADVGVIALSLALAPPMKAAGRYWEIPVEAHPPIEQGVVLLKGARQPAVAEKLLEFVKGSAGRAIMTRYGFVVPTLKEHP